MFLSGLFVSMVTGYVITCIPLIRPIQVLLGNFSATFRSLSNFFVREQLLATFWKTSTFLVTFGLFKVAQNSFQHLDLDGSL